MRGDVEDEVRGGGDVGGKGDEGIGKEMDEEGERRCKRRRCRR